MDIIALKLDADRHLPRKRRRATHQSFVQPLSSGLSVASQPEVRLRGPLRRACEGIRHSQDYSGRIGFENMQAAFAG
jgi:hypothetical protein